MRGQLASTSSATQVRLFLPCSRKVQSSRERSRAFRVSSPTPLQGGILREMEEKTKKKQKCLANCTGVRSTMRPCSCAVLQQTYRVAAAVSLHLDALVWDLHVDKLRAEGQGCEVETALLDIRSTSGPLSLTSVLRPLKGMLVSHIATR